MKYLQPAMGFHVELNENSLLIAVKGYKLIKGVVPSTYGDIMDDLPLLNGVTLESLSFHIVFEELMTKSKLFLEEKFLTSKNIFFLRKCVLYGTYHWVHMIAWGENGYGYAENPNGNFFVEPWRDYFYRKRFPEDSIFFVLQSYNLEENVKEKLILKNQSTFQERMIKMAQDMRDKINSDPSLLLNF